MRPNILLMRYHTPATPRSKTTRDSKVSLDRVRYKERVDAVLCHSRANTPTLHASGCTYHYKKYDASPERNYLRHGSYYNLYDPNPQQLRSSLKRVPNTARERMQPKALSFGQFHKGIMLAEGKFGKVFVVKHKQTGSVFGMKVMSKKLIVAQNYVGQLAQEIKLQMLVNNPNVIQLYGFFADSENVYLIQELGLDPNLYFQLKTSPGQRLQRQQAQGLVRMIALGLQAIHQEGIVHRDIKPQNIIMSMGVPKICDFGWCAPLNRKLNCFCGTLDYVAPEIIRGQNHNEKVDVWCLGVLTFELLCGHTPFYHEQESVIFKNIIEKEVQYPLHLGLVERDFISRLLRQRAEDRPSVQEVLLHNFVQQQ